MSNFYQIKTQAMQDYQSPRRRNRRAVCGRWPPEMGNGKRGEQREGAKTTNQTKKKDRIIEKSREMPALSPGEAPLACLEEANSGARSNASSGCPASRWRQNAKRGALSALCVLSQGTPALGRLVITGRSMANGQRQFEKKQHRTQKENPKCRVMHALANPGQGTRLKSTQ